MAGPSKRNSLKQPRDEFSVQSVKKPPTIAPNYAGQKRSMTLKSKVSRVLLYDNASQDYMLGIKLHHIDIERERICRIINLNKRTFCSQQKIPFSVVDSSATKTASSCKHKKPRAAGTANANYQTPSPMTKDAVVYKQGGLTAMNLQLEGMKLPQIDNGKRHVIFQGTDVKGNSQLYYTVDKGIIGDVIPMHNFYRSLIDDPRFRSLEDVLVPSEKP